MSIPAGKLPPEMLRALLSRLPPPSAGVIVGPQLGEDAAVVDVGGRYIVAASDPVTLSAQPGSFAVHVNANDVAVMGAEPRWLLASVLLPLGCTPDDARSVMDGLGQAARDLGIAIVGGHTEITPSVTRPVVAATMLGEVEPGRLVRSSGARTGDALLLAGPLAVEGTAIVASEYRAELERRGVPAGTIEDAAALLQKPGISVLPATRALLSAVLPHAMHDPTEGGLLSALREVADASGTGARLYPDRVLVYPSCRAVCAALQLDPLGLLASGSLLAALAPADVGSALRALQESGIEAAVIGEALPSREDLFLWEHGGDKALPLVERDELARWIERRC